MSASVEPVPFCVPFRAAAELAYIGQALDEGSRSGEGTFSRRARALLGTICGGGTALLTTSGTAALELATLTLGLGVGDEVVMPSFTFTSVGNAVALRGATPVFVDIDPETLNLDPELFEAAIGPRTKAVIVVHYAGVICDMERIGAIARRHGIVVIEDAAHAIGSTRDGRPAGSFGDMAAFSFHYTKNVTCGEGGCLIVNRPELLARAEIAFDKGTNRTDFSRGRVDKYTWLDAGGSFTMGEVNAAMLVAQLEALDEITALRLGHWGRYRDALAGFGNAGIELPHVGVAEGHNAHMFQLLLASNAARTRFIDAMREKGITAPFHYVPLHSSPAGRRLGRSAGPMGVTDDIAGRLVRLPLYPALGEKGARVIDAVGASQTARPGD